MNSTFATLARAAALGLAVGGRSSAGLAALTATTAAADPDWLASTPLRIGAGLMATAEVTADKLPNTPSRKEAAGLGARFVAGAVAGALLGRRHGVAPVLVAAVGVAGAYAGTQLGSRWRTIAAARFGTDLPGAVVEDVWVASLAAAATRS